MKILILANNSGGLHDFRGDLIATLLREHRVIASTPFNDKVSELKKLGCQLIETPVDRRGVNPVRDIRLFRTYCTLLKKEKPDLVITYTIKPNIYGGLACRLHHIPYAANITGLGTTFQTPGLLRTLVTWMYRISLKKAKVVFFENVANRDVFLQLSIVRVEQCHVLHGAGVNLEHFSYTEYPTDDSCTRFLFMGRIMREKGVDELFEAMRKLRADGVKCSLDMLGGFDEDYSARIKEAESEGWLKYHGYQSDVRPFIAKCHCFVLPSWHEGMANTNLECAATGRPVITSDIHGCLEAVEDGISGYLVECKNADALYEAMKKFGGLNNEERKSMGLAGRMRMETIFDKKKVIENTISRLFS